MNESEIPKQTLEQVVQTETSKVSTPILTFEDVPFSAPVVTMLDSKKNLIVLKNPILNLSQS